MRLEHDGAAGGFVAATSLHAHVAVFHDVDTADTVVAAHLVQIGQYLRRGHVLAVDGNDIALTVGQFDVGRGVGGVFRGNAPAPHVFFVLGPGVFQYAAFIRDVQQVGVHGVRGLLAVTLNGDVVLFSVGQQLLAGHQVPLAPWRNHFYARLKRIGTQLETHLVVALAGGTVGDGIGTGFVGNFNQALGDQRTGDGSTQQVLAFINGVGAEHRENKVAHKFFTQVVDVDFLDTQRFGLGTGRLDLLALTQVSGEGNDFALVLVLQPLEDYRGIQATGIGQNHLFDIGHASTPGRRHK